MRHHRRLLLAGALGALAFPKVFAQSRIPRVGMIVPRIRSESFWTPGVLRRLNELGYREGTTMILEYRSSEGAIDRYPSIARELIDLKCDVVFTVGVTSTIAMRDLQYPVPVVFLATEIDPLSAKVVSSLRRPGVNATGVFIPQNDLVAKRLQIVRELLPGARRFLLLADRTSNDQLAVARKMAGEAGVQLTVVEFPKRPYDYAAAFAAGKKAEVDAVMLLSSPIFSTDRAAIAAAATKYRLPGIAHNAQMVDAGLLLALFADPAKAGRRAADIAVQILKGAKAADIPVQQADEFEVVINAKTARELGINIPPVVLARATRVVQ